MYHSSPWCKGKNKGKKTVSSEQWPLFFDFGEDSNRRLPRIFPRGMPGERSLLARRESFSRCHDKCRICLPGKSGIYRVYEAKILGFPVISTKNRSCWTALIRQELFFLPLYFNIFRHLLVQNCSAQCSLKVRGRRLRTKKDAKDRKWVFIIYEICTTSLIRVAAA